MSRYYWADKKTTKKKKIQEEEELPLPQEPVFLVTGGGHDGMMSNPVECFDNNVFFYGEVNEENAKILNRTLRSMDKDLQTASIRFGVEAPIRLYINSNGGSVLAGFSIVDTIQSLGTDVHTYIDGSAASAATLISIAGDKRFAHKNSFMLIHQLSSNFWGKYEEIKDEMHNIDLLMSRITEIYTERTKVPKRELEKILKRDIWLDADKCVEWGLVDEIV